MLAAIPYRFGYRAIRALVRHSDLNREQADAALASLRRFAPGLDRGFIPDRYRLIQALDVVDLYLSLTRSDRWLSRQVRVEGEWPAPNGPMAFITFHYGAGMWALRHLRATHHAAHFVSLPVRREMFGSDWPTFRYLSRRLAANERFLSLPSIFTGEARARIESAWRAGESIVAIVDNPEHLGQFITTTVCGRPFRLPAGLGASAVKHQIRIVPFDCSLGMDPAVPWQRKLRIHAAFVPVSVQDYADRLGAIFTSMLERDPSAWHLAMHAGTFFRPA